MPFYTLSCPGCNEKSEHLMGMNDQSLLVKCPMCARSLNRTLHRDYAADVPQIQGETVAGGCVYAGFDVGMGIEIKSKAHRADEMKKRDLVPFSPDPVAQNHRNNMNYIKKSSQADDPQAAKAIRKEMKESETKRRDKKMSEAFDKAFNPATVQ